MKVSVSITTFNQQAYIAQALDGVLMQRVNFDYEIVIGDDYSTDNTRRILQAYQTQHPDKIRLLLPERNLGLLGKHNFIAALNACRGQYIALLDGDDYWIDPQKLQKQADSLDSHGDYAFSCHRVLRVRDDDYSEPELYPME